MNRRHFLTTAAAALVATPALAQQKLSLNAISNYLNGIQGATSDFTQVNDDGTLSTGQFYLLRPGRMRFEYNPPERLLVMAGGGQVGMFDGKSNVKRAERYPLSQTPLSIILERSVNLGQRNMVTGHSFDGTATVVTAQDPQNPQYGNIQMKFTDSPVQLRQWVVTDGQGARTTVILGDLRKTTGLSASLFNIQAEENRRGG